MLLITTLFKIDYDTMAMNSSAQKLQEDMPTNGFELDDDDLYSKILPKIAPLLD